MGRRCTRLIGGLLEIQDFIHLFVIGIKIVFQHLGNLGIEVVERGILVAVCVVMAHGGDQFGQPGESAGDV